MNGKALFAALTGWQVAANLFHRFNSLNKGGDHMSSEQTNYADQKGKWICSKEQPLC